MISGFHVRENLVDGYDSCGRACVERLWSKQEGRLEVPMPRVDAEHGLSADQSSKSGGSVLGEGGWVSHQCEMMRIVREAY